MRSRTRTSLSLSPAAMKISFRLAVIRGCSSVLRCRGAGTRSVAFVQVAPAPGTELYFHAAIRKVQRFLVLRPKLKVTRKWPSASPHEHHSEADFSIRVGS